MYYEKIKQDFNKLVEQQEANNTNGSELPEKCYTMIHATCRIRRDYNLNYWPMRPYHRDPDDKDVYFARAENGLTKIGISSDVIERVKSLQRLVLPFDLQIIRVIPAGGHRLEQALHHEFRHLRACGEWFFLDMDDTTVAEL